VLRLAKKYIIGFLILLVLASAVYVSLGVKVRIRVDKDKTTLYLKNERNRWIIVGREYLFLFDGTSKMNRNRSGIEIETFINNISQTVKIIKYTPYIRGPIITQTYEFQGKIDDISLFPIYHKVEVLNGSGFFLRYEVRDLFYSGPTYKLSREIELKFERNIKVILNPNYRWAWIYKAGIVRAQYDIPTNNETLYFRLYDPDLEAPKYYDNSTNSTLAGSDVLHSLNWTDDTGLSGYIFSFYNGTTLASDVTIKANDTASHAESGYNQSLPPVLVTFGLGSELSASDYLEVGASEDTRDSQATAEGFYPFYRFDTTLSGTQDWVYVSWEGQANAAGGGKGCILYIWNYTGSAWVEEDFANCWNNDKTLTKNITTSSELSDYISGNIIHHLVMYDVSASGVTLSMDYGYIKHNITTDKFINDTWVSFGGSTWSNVTKTVNSIADTTIQWCVYANDTSNNWNGSSCTIPFDYVTTSPADTCTCDTSGWDIDCSDNCNNTVACDMGGNDITITNAGTFYTSADIFNYGTLTFKGQDAANKCIITCDGGCFKE